MRSYLIVAVLVVVLGLVANSQATPDRASIEKMMNSMGRRGMRPEHSETMQSFQKVSICIKNCEDGNEECEEACLNQMESPNLRQALRNARKASKELKKN